MPLGLFPRSHQLAMNLGKRSGSVVLAQGWEQARAGIEASVYWCYSDFHKLTSKGIFVSSRKEAFPVPSVSSGSTDWLMFQRPCYMGKLANAALPFPPWHPPVLESWLGARECDWWASSHECLPPYYAQSQMWGFMVRPPNKYKPWFLPVRSSVSVKCNQK